MIRHRDLASRRQFVLLRFHIVANGHSIQGSVHCAGQIDLPLHEPDDHALFLGDLSGNDGDFLTQYRVPQCLGQLRVLLHLVEDLAYPAWCGHGLGPLMLGRLGTFVLSVSGRGFRGWLEGTLSLKVPISGLLASSEHLVAGSRCGSERGIRLPEWELLA